MTILTNASIKNKLLNLTESLWIFASLNALLESGALALLMQPTTWDSLQKKSNMPLIILKQAVNLLSQNGLLHVEDESIQFADDLKTLIHHIGFARFAAQLYVTRAMSNEFIQAAQAGNLQAGWHYTDENILQAQGTHSEYIVTDVIPQDQDLDELLKQDHKLFLDVGAGVGKIAIKLCERYDRLKVIALEPADTPYQLAQQNIHAANLNERISLRKTYIEDFTEQHCIDATWFPHVFFPDAIFMAGLTKVWQALKPNGIILTTALLANQQGQSMSVRALINSLYGGLRTADDVVDALTKVGFTQIKRLSEVSGYQTITAKKR